MSWVTSSPAHFGIQTLYCGTALLCPPSQKKRINGPGTMKPRPVYITAYRDGHGLCSSASLELYSCPHRFTLSQNKGPWATRTSIDISDDGDNVDDWNVLLSALRNWSDASADVRKFCLEYCTGNTQVGFVNRISIGTHINGRYKPLPGFDAADTVYLFLEDLRVGPDGYIVPSKRYWSLDRKGETPMSDALKTLYNLDQSETWDIRKSIRFFDSEQFAALDQLRIRFGGILRSEAPGSLSGTWRHVCSPRKRSQSLTRL
ncbi:hypothetical protein DFH08DRAFT_832038, partial [Mycena albidolilacea]